MTTKTAIDASLRLPSFLKLAPAFAHAPGLFQSIPKGQARQLHDLKYQAGEFHFRFVGPQFGPMELRVLQGLTGLAALQTTQPTDRVPGDMLKRISSATTQHVVIDTTYNQLARTIGYRENSGSSNTAIRSALERLFMLSVFVGYADSPRSKDFAALHLFNRIGSQETRGRLVVEMCPVLAAAVLGGRGEYLRVSLDEVRQLQSDVALLLHQRLHWINPGQSGKVGLEKLVAYVWPKQACDSTMRARRRDIRLALEELAAIGWCIEWNGSLCTIGRPDPEPNPAVSTTGGLPYRQRLPAVSTTPVCSI
ncbi:MAG: replication protein C, IncQ-type [Hylemonella sp.]|uniref:replication protein C, IncQ-type n=1 Tax=Hylemonella sp. TaxID=2066020 RepID=UPI003919BE31